MKYLVCLLYVASFLWTTQSHANIHALERQKHVEYWIQTLDQHPFVLVRKNAAMHLGDLQHRMAVPSLIKALQDAKEEVVMEAVKSLGMLGDPQAIKPLYELTVTQSNEQIADQARRSIGKIKAYLEFKEAQSNT